LVIISFMWIVGWLSSSYLLVDRSTKFWGPITQKCLLKFIWLQTCVKKRPYHLFDNYDMFDKDEIDNLIKMIHNCHDQIMFYYHIFKSGQNNFFFKILFRFDCRLNKYLHVLKQVPSSLGTINIVKWWCGGFDTIISCKRSIIHAFINVSFNFLLKYTTIIFVYLINISCNWKSNLILYKSHITCFATCFINSSCRHVI
jgi:hypothetical protein